MQSHARLLYESHLLRAANAIRMASTVLLLNALPEEADRLDALQAWLLNELERCQANRRPMGITPPMSSDFGSTPRASGQRTHTDTQT